MTAEEKDEALVRLKLLVDETDAESGGAGSGAQAGCEACEVCEGCAGAFLGAESERYFSDAELEAILDLHEGDVREAAYDILIRKAQSTGVRLAGGVQLADQRAYWLSRARAVRPNRGRAGVRADGT